MQSTFQKIASLLLAFLLVFSTVSFTVKKHYCGRFLVDIAVFSSAKDCGMNKMNSSDHLEMDFEKASCCKDEVQTIEGQNECKFSFDQLEIPQQQFLAVFCNSYTIACLTRERIAFGYEEYAPPERILDIQVLYETFLI
ncbi:hypothetical protein GCM10022393_23710 [Aquimarina addita]|uniref:Uncharacterized protein n=1 Tax=Aquimarina addita TaxID=870485 RepID=A0ABP6UJX8_9FLAO